MKEIILCILLLSIVKFGMTDNTMSIKIKNKARGKISLETKNLLTNIGLNSEIIITDNVQYYQINNTDNIGKLNISLPVGTYQIYTISNGYNIQVSNVSIIKDSTSDVIIGLSNNENTVLKRDTTRFYIFGFIVDKETNQPISQVTILDSKTNTLASSDSIGYFQFNPTIVNKIEFKKHKNRYKLNTMNVCIVKTGYDIIDLKNYIPIKGLNIIKIFLLKGNGRQKIEFKASSLINN